MRRKRLGVVCILLGGASLWQSRPAHAQYIEGAARLGLKGNVFSSFSMTLEAEGEKVDSTRTESGLIANGAGVIFSFGPTELLQIGAQVGFASSIQTIDVPGAEDVRGSGFAFYPRIDFVLVPGSVARPFLGPALGWEGATTKVADVETTVSTTLFGVNAGVHFFPDSAVSITPALTMGTVTGSVEVADSAADVDLEADVSGFGTMLSLSVSGWFGGAASKPPAPRKKRQPESDLSEGEAQPEGGAGPVGAAAPPDNRGALTMGFSAGVGKGVRINGRPRKNGTQIQVYLSQSNGPSEIEDCRGVTVHADDESFEVSNVQSGSAEQGFGRSRFVRAMMPVEAVYALAEARGDAWIYVCGDRWDVPRSVRPKLYKFANRFRSQAESFGTWEAPDRSKGRADDDATNGTEGTETETTEGTEAEPTGEPAATETDN